MRQINGRTHRVQVPVEAPPHDAVGHRIAALAQIMLVPLRDVRLGGHELHDARHHGLTVLRLDDIDHMVVGIRMVLDQDLTDHADAHLARDVLERQRVKGFHDLLDQRPIRQEALADRLRRGGGAAVMLDRLAHDRVPLPIQRVRAAGRDLIRAHAVQAFHQQIADDQRLQRAVDELRGRLEAGVVLQALRRDRDDRDLRIAGVHQRLADQAEVVGRTAHAAGLGDGQRHLVRIVLTFKDRVDQLADDHDGRIAGVVVHVLEADLDVLMAGMFEHIELVAGRTDHRLDEREVDRAHLRGHNRVVLLHGLAERDLVGVLGQRGRVVRPLLALPRRGVP